MRRPEADCRLDQLREPLHELENGDRPEDGHDNDSYDKESDGKLSSIHPDTHRSTIGQALRRYTQLATRPLPCPSVGVESIATSRRRGEVSKAVENLKARHQAGVRRALRIAAGPRLTPYLHIG
jgi:hypothetical protein